MNFDSTINADSIIAIVGIIVSILIALPSIRAVLKSTKKYELTENYRKEILSWYSAVVDLMIKIIHYIESGIFFEARFSQQKTDLLSKLSSMIEVGRFYFPNVIKDDDHGKEKSSAYQGHRDLNLEYLITFYRIASTSKDDSKINLLWENETNFTSAIFDIVEPRERIKSYTKYLSIPIYEGKSGFDYLNKQTEKRASK